jgi:ferredoxin like protein
MSIEERLAADKHVVDEGTPHIVVDVAACATCTPQDCACVKACPAGLFKAQGDTVTFDYAGCLECGTCRIVCFKKAIAWNHPEGGFGVEYRYG